MALPDAIVEISLTGLAGLEDLVDEDRRFYALARVGNRVLGRSEWLEFNEDTYDLSADPAGFSHTIFARHPGNVLVEVAIWKDLKDDPPEKVLAIEARLPGPWRTGR